MKFRVKGVMANDVWVCLDEQGKAHYVDFLVDGGVSREEIGDPIGKILECAYVFPYIEIAMEVKLCEEEK